MKNRVRKFIVSGLSIYFILSILTIGIVSGQSRANGGETTKNQIPAGSDMENPLETTYTEIASLRYKNEIAASDKYAGQYVKMTGIVSDVSDIAGIIAIRFKEDESDVLSSMNCYFDNKQTNYYQVKSFASRLRKGQRTILTGRMPQKISQYDRVVTLSPCRIELDTTNPVGEDLEEENSN